MRQPSHFPAKILVTFDHRQAHALLPTAVPKTPKQTVPDATPTTDRRARTHRRLIAEAMKLARHGSVVSVAEVAAAAGVSRATAYRYFPTHSALIDAIVAESLGPVRRFESLEQDGVRRIVDLFERTSARLSEFEPQLRAALQVALDHWAKEKSGVLHEKQFRRGNRREILDRAARPLAEVLGNRQYTLMLKALSLVYGVESHVVLKDIWGASNKEVHAVVLWVATAILERSLRDANA